LTRIGQEKKMAVINTNVKALFSQAALRSTERSQSVAMQQLSTGKRINSARDDAAGMAIATRMTHQIRSLNQAVRNAGDAITLIQTAEGATNEITDMMQRMRELAIQAVNDTNDNAQRSYLDLEFQQLKQEIVHISESTEWNGFPVLNGTAGERVGEMPVYKTTATSEFSTAYVNPTTERKISGTGAGETQSVVFSGTALGLNVTGADRSITIDGVTVQVTKTDIDEALVEIHDALTQSDRFSKSSGREVTLDAANKTLVFKYASSDKDVSAIEVTMSAALDSTLNAAVGSQGAADAAVVAASEAFMDGQGEFLKSGALTIDWTPNSLDATQNKLTATFLTSDGKTIQMTGEIGDPDGSTVTFLKDQGLNGQVISNDMVYTFRDSADNAVDITTRPVSMEVSVSGGIPALKAGDLLINGVDVGPTFAEDDTLSPPNNAAGSAIAKAAAINRKAVSTTVSTGESQTLTLMGTPKTGTIKVGGVSIQLNENIHTTAVQAAAAIAAALKASPLYDIGTGRTITYSPGSTTIGFNYSVNEGDVADVPVSAGTTGLVGTVDTTMEHQTRIDGTGVFAKVNENIVTGRAMSSTNVVKGAVFINGFASADITTVLNNPRETRANVVRAINLISDKTGVKAIDTGFDNQGVTLVAADGRNIEVRFETDFNANLFGESIGMRQGVQAGTYSLESKIQAPVILTSSAIGDIGRSGLIAGNFTKNQSVFNTSERAPVVATQAQVESVKFSTGASGAAADDLFTLTVNGVEFSHKAAAGETASQIRNSLIAKVKDVGVTATAGNSTDELLLTADIPGIAYSLKVSDTSADGAVTNDEVYGVTKANIPAEVKTLSANDLVINGVKIRATTTADDKFSSTVSTSSDKTASAIAIAAAINSHSPETGVRAFANPVLSQGAITTVLPTPLKGPQSLFVNGTEVTVELDPMDTVLERRTKVVDAINQRVGQHGVTASDNGYGVTLSGDGRNLSVWFDASVEGLDAASFGLDKGGSVAQVSQITLSGTDVDKQLSIKLNGKTITTAGSAASLAEVAAQMKTAIEASGLKNIGLEVVGNALQLTSKVPGTGFTLTGASVTPPTADLGMNLETLTPNSVGNNDVTGILNATEKSTTAKTLYGTVRMISDPALLPNLVAPEGAPPSDRAALLKATGKPFTVSVGDDGFGKNSNFAAMGFEVGTFGGQSSAAMDPPRVGRLAFQVGASANQMITIDLADFGKNGSITSQITGDVDLNVEQRSARINTREGATAVLTMLDESMDKINATRATMGAIMNRLDHVISNLTNVSMNLSASRSQIEDADYAQASTNLAKTQIMQQAATAVLAQANTSQQSVMKLLGG
jgi:flagellin